MMVSQLTLSLLLSILLLCNCSLGGTEELTFTQTSYQVSVNETFDDGKVVQPNRLSSPVLLPLTVSCNSSNETELTYALLEDDLPFAINSTSGELIVTHKLNYEDVIAYEFTAVCTSVANESCNATTNVTVNLLPLNEFRPVGSTSNVFYIISEDTPPGVLNSTLPGVQYTITDNDRSDDPLFYTLTEGTNNEFPIFFNETIGAFVLGEALYLDNRSDASCFIIVRFRIKVCDVSPPMDVCPNILVLIQLQFSNNHDPSFAEERYSTTVSELTPTNTTLLRVTCTDVDICVGGFGGFEIMDENLNETFSIDDDGNITNLELLDFESVQSYMINVRCYDMSGVNRQRQAFMTVEVVLLDENDNCPRCIIPEIANLKAGRHQRTQVLLLSCEDDDEGLNSQLTFSIEGSLPEVINGLFMVNRSTGELTFTGEISPGDYNLSIIVADSGNPPLRTKVLVKVTVTTEVGGVPMLVVIVVPIVGGLLLLCCLFLLCFSCCFYYTSHRQNKKKMMSKSLYVTPANNIEMKQIYNTSSEDREITLFYDNPDVTTSSFTGSGQGTPETSCNASVSNEDYVMSNTVLTIDKDPQGIVEAVSYEMEKLDPSKKETSKAWESQSITFSLDSDLASQENLVISNNLEDVSKV